MNIRLATSCTVSPYAPITGPSNGILPIYLAPINPLRKPLRPAIITCDVVASGSCFFNSSIAQLPVNIPVKLEPGLEVTTPCIGCPAYFCHICCKFFVDPDTGCTNLRPLTRAKISGPSILLAASNNCGALSGTPPGLIVLATFPATLLAPYTTGANAVPKTAPVMACSPLEVLP